MSLPELKRILRTFRIAPTASAQGTTLLFPIKVNTALGVVDKWILEIGYAAPSGVPNAMFYLDLSNTDQDGRVYNADDAFSAWSGPWTVSAF